MGTELEDITDLVVEDMDELYSEYATHTPGTWLLLYIYYFMLFYQYIAAKPITISTSCERQY